MLLAPPKYNPGFDNDEVLIRSFVIRERYLDLILEVLRANTSDANQHLLVIGPRGAGKTMLVRRVAAEIRTKAKLAAQWYPIVFAEESYRVMSPGEFWLEALSHLADQTQEERWQSVYDNLRNERDESRLQQRALAQLMDFADEQGKRLLLIVENLNMLLEEQLGDQDDWDLRHTLLNEPRLMLLGTATEHFNEIQNIDRAWFELLALYELKQLNIGECQVFWESLTNQKIKELSLKPIQILTGGNPRLIRILAGFATTLSLRELIDNLIQLVDNHTEYFKSKLDNLPSSERKVFVTLLELWDPSIARDVAQAARMEVSKTSALLNRLVKRGAVVVADPTSHKKTYQVAERLYNIYYLMRRHSHPSNRVRAAVTFMVHFYQDDLVKPIVKIAEEACGLNSELRKDHYWAYQDIISSQRVDSNVKAQILHFTPEKFYRFPDFPKQLQTLIGKVLAEYRQNTLGKAHPNHEKIAAQFRSSDVLDLEFLEELLHQQLNSYDEAVQAIRNTIKRMPDFYQIWALLGLLLDEELGQYEEAEQAYRKAVELEPSFILAFGKLGYLYLKLNRYEQAEETIRQVLEYKSDCAWAWALLGIIYEESARFELAIQAFRKVLEYDPDADLWAILGILHERLEQYEQAIQAYQQVLERKPDNAWAYWTMLGLLYEKVENYEEAEQAYRQAVHLGSTDWCALIDLSVQQGKDLRPLLQEAQQHLAQSDRNATLLNALARGFYETGESEFLSVAEAWAKEAVEKTGSKEWRYLHTLVVVLSGQDKWQDTLELATPLIEAGLDIPEAQTDLTSFVINTAAAGYAQEVLHLIENSKAASVFEPLVVGLRIFLGANPSIAQEILEIGQDVAQRIRDRQDQIHAEVMAGDSV